MSALCLSNPFISLNLLTIGHICPHSFGFNQPLCTGEAIQKHLGVRNNVAITPILHLHTWVALSNSFYINFSQTFPCWNKQPHEAQPSHPFPASTSQGPERKQGFQWDPCVSLRLSVLKKGILFHFPPDLHSIPCSHLTFSSSLLLMTIFFLPHCFSFFLLTLLLLFHHLVLFSLSAPFPLLQSLIFPRSRLPPLCFPFASPLTPFLSHFPHGFQSETQPGLTLPSCCRSLSIPELRAYPACRSTSGATGRPTSPARKLPLRMKVADPTGLLLFLEF